MIYLQTENLTKSVGDRMLFADLSFGISQGDKIGVVAKNGTGKSTLLRILAGKEAADSGTVTLRSGLRVAMLDQEPRFDASATTASVAASMPPDRAVEFASLATRMGIDTVSAIPVSKLSGGQRKRLAIAVTVASAPDLLILDEPTNHLDIATVEWLEGYLTRARITLLMVTHDRYFLDRVCNVIFELHRTSLHIHPGNYAKYLQRRAERIEAMGAELDRVRNTLRREQEWMSRQPQARAGKSRSRIDRFHDLKERSQVNLREDDVRLNGQASYIGNKIFEARHIAKAYGDKVILKDFNYVFARYDKVGIVGDNGVGKSTLIKMLQGLVPPDAGVFDVGQTVRFGYYSQDGIAFDRTKKVIDAVSAIADEIEIKEGETVDARQFLQQFLFSVPDQQKYIHTLSGGELCRLHLATVLMRRPNFLILDEPTNDLDLVTLGVLEEYLANFKGCLLVVSHDRYFLDNIVDHLFVMQGDGNVRDYPGTYTEYRAECARQQSQSRPAEAGPAKSNVKPRTLRAPKLTYKEQREFESLEKEIESLNAEKAALEAVFNDGAPGDDIAAASARYGQVKDLLDEKEMRWLELSEKA